MTDPWDCYIYLLPCPETYRKSTWKWMVEILAGRAMSVSGRAIYHTFWLNVGKYTSPMDPMTYELGKIQHVLFPSGIEVCWSPLWMFAGEFLTSKNCTCSWSKVTRYLQLAVIINCAKAPTYPTPGVSRLQGSRTFGARRHQRPLVVQPRSLVALDRPWECLSLRRSRMVVAMMGWSRWQGSPKKGMAFFLGGGSWILGWIWRILGEKQVRVVFCFLGGRMVVKLMRVV